MPTKTLVARALALVRRVFFWLPSSTSEERVPETSHDHALILAVTETKSMPGLRQLRYGLRVVLSLQERQLVASSLVVLLLSGGLALGFFIHERTVRVPVVGGTLIEAIVGEPKYINPLDAPANDVDRDLVSLIYSGLFRMDGLTAVPDLAEKFSWSDDYLTLTVNLRPDARFHNGQSVTANDVQYTFDAIQDPTRSSRLSSRFRGVKVSATDTATVQFTQEHPDVTLLQALTVGILPADVWQDIPSANARLADLNIKPIGSGPYRFKVFTRDNKGFIKSYTLERWDDYYGLKPYLKNLTFQFYPDRKQAEDALKADLVDALAFTNMQDGQKDSKRWHQIKLNLPQETIAFFNLKNTLLSDERIRRALAGVIDRQEIVDAWNGQAAPINGPFPFRMSSTTVMDLDQARTLLESANWTLPPGGAVRVLTPKPKPVPAAASKRVSVTTSPVSPTPTTTAQELTLTIITSDQTQLVSVAETLKRRWSLIGVRVNVNVVASEELLRAATRERNGQVIVTNVLLDASQDMFPFWWSGQATDRGLNISNLADRDVDTALENVRHATSTDGLEDSQDDLANRILRTTPAAFLVRPSSTYLVSKNIQGVHETTNVSRPADRFQDIVNWYASTGWRWK